MPRPITLFTGQWADLPFEEVCSLAASWGYDGVEIACNGDHFDVRQALGDPAYVAGRPPPSTFGWRCGPSGSTRTVPFPSRT